MKLKARTLFDAVQPHRSPTVPRIQVAFLEHKTALMNGKHFKPGVSSFQLHTDAIDDVALADQLGYGLTRVVADARSTRPPPISAGLSRQTGYAAPSRPKTLLFTACCLTRACSWRADPARPWQGVQWSLVSTGRPDAVPDLRPGPRQATPQLMHNVRQT